MLKKNQLFRILNLLLVSTNLNSSAPALIANNDNLWGSRIDSPQVNADGLPIGHHAILANQDYSLSAMLPLPLVDGVPMRRGTEFWGDHEDHRGYLEDYKQAVNHKLRLLMSELKKEGFNFDDESLQESPCGKIEFMKNQVRQAREVEKIVADDNAKKIQTEFKTACFARGMLGVCVLAGACVLLQKKLK